MDRDLEYGVGSCGIAGWEWHRPSIGSTCKPSIEGGARAVVSSVVRCPRLTRHINHHSNHQDRTKLGPDTNIRNTKHLY